jgi:hypothetical protein
MPRLRNIAILALLLAALAAAYALGRLVPSTDAWKLEHLLSLDPLEPDSTADITALYARQHGFDCQVRFDLLILPDSPDFTLQLTLNGQEYAFQPDSPAISYDFLADTLTLTLENCSIKPNAGIQLALLAPDGRLLDLALASLSARIEPAPYLLAFSNSFEPAATPIQALRRWDGAHTGPRGERHGLRYLLTSAEKYQIPLALLDFATPETLSALDALGGLPQLHRMAQNDLVIFPFMVNGGFSAARNLAAAQAFGLSRNSFCADYSAPGLACRYQFTTLPADYLRVALVRNPVGYFLPLPSLRTGADTIDDSGLNLAAREALHSAALSPETDVVILGGSFPQTTWGTPDYLDPAFAYLAARPYLAPLVTPNADAFPGAEEKSLILPNLLPVLHPALKNLPPNPISDSALGAYLVNQGFSTPDELRISYEILPQLLAQAARWTDSPQEIEDCDGQTCVLASQTVLAFLSRDGRLVFLFVRDEKGETHQLVGPTAQFFIGLSDSSRWNPAAGLGADPVPGNSAFFVQRADASLAPVISSEKEFILGPEIKYRLLENGIRVTLKAEEGGAVTIPLVIDPWRRLEPGWSGQFIRQEVPGGWQLGWEKGPMVRIQATGLVENGLAAPALETPFDAMSFIQLPENPNAEFPPGIFLPFGMSLIRLQGNDLTVEITLVR